MLWKFVMEAQISYNATVWTMKSFPSTIVVRSSLRKPTQTAGKAHRTHNAMVWMNDIEWE